MGFEFPAALLTLLFLPLLLWHVWRADQQTLKIARAFKSRPPGRWFSFVRLGLVAILLASLAIIGARPYLQTPNTGDYLFVADVSRSMNARFSCTEPSFLERAKSVMRTVLAAVPEGRFGIVAADRFAFPVSQMTYDHAYLDEVIENGLFVGLTYEATATDIGNALSVVAAKKTALPEIFGNVRQVVLLSDGHIQGDYMRSLRQPIDELVKAGVGVVAVGIGNSGRTPIPEEERETCKDEYIRIGGEVVSIPMRADILEYIAQETGGVFAVESETDKVVQYLRQQGLTPVEGGFEGGSRQHRDIGWIFLIPATLALAGMLLLRLRPSF